MKLNLTKKVTLLSFGVNLFLLFVLYFSYGHLKNILLDIDHLIEIEQPKTAASYEIEINLFETDLSIWRHLYEVGDVSLVHLEEDKKELKAAVEHLSTLSLRGDLSESLLKLGALLQQYEAEIQSLLILKAESKELTDKVGKEDLGMIGDLRKSIHKLELKLVRSLKSTIQNAHNPIMISLLMCRRHEKDFLLRGKTKYVDLFEQEVLNLQNLIRESQEIIPVEQLNYLGLIGEYQKLFSKVTDLILKKDDLEVDLYQHLRTLELLSIEINREVDEKLQVASLKSLLESGQRVDSHVGKAINVFLTLIVVAIILGLYFSLKSAPKLAKSIGLLTSGVQKFSEGDLSHRVDVRSKDEIGELALAFNEMAQSLQKTKTDLVESVDKAKIASESKSNFLAMMSHEVRTPLNISMGMLSLLEGTEVSEEQKGYLKAALKSNRDLLKVLENILNYSSLEFDDLKPNLEMFNLKVTLNSLVEVFSHQCFDKGLDYTLELEERVCENVIGDHVKLKQLLMCLVENAIKFTSQGQVRIKVSVVLDLKHNQRLLFSVKDTGIGISKEDKDKIFDSFQQADMSHSRKYGGTGLGLSLAQKLANAMDSNIRVESEFGKGSEFSFELTLSNREDEVLVKDVEWSKTSCLFLGKSSSFSESAIESIQAKEGRVVRAENYDVLNEVLKQAQSEFTFIFINFFQVTLSQPMIIELLGSSQMTKTTPIIVMSANGVRGEAYRARSYNAAAYYTPPYSFEVFEKILNKVLNIEPFEKVKNFEKTIITKHDILGEGDLSGEMNNVLGRHSKKKVLLADDVELNLKLASKIISKFGFRYETALNGEEAIKLWREGDFDMVLLDLQMPFLDGFAACKKIRELEKEKGKEAIPIFALTANVSDADREKAMEAGMNEFIVKPLKQRSLIEMMTKYFRED